MVINVSVQNNGGFLPDILLTFCNNHVGEAFVPTANIHTLALLEYDIPGIDYTESGENHNL